MIEVIAKDKLTDITLIAREKNIGEWEFYPSAFATYVNAFDVPSALLTLGGTYMIETDWNSDDSFVRYSMIEWLINSFSQFAFGGARFEFTSVTGVDEPRIDYSNDPEGTVY